MIYEYPTHEVSRFCLRMEKLTHQIQLLRSLGTPDGLHMAIEHQVELIQMLDRPDIRTKLTKVLTITANRYQEFLKSDAVDQIQLHVILDQMKEHLLFLQNHARNHMQSVHQSAMSSLFLQNITAPARLSEFSVPLLKVIKRNNDMTLAWLENWFESMAPFQNIGQLLLEIFRLDTDEYQLISDLGHCHLDLSGQDEVILLQIDIAENNIFPSISFGRGRLSIHFHELGARVDQSVSTAVKRAIPIDVRITKLAKLIA